ncbi:MAG: response regulator, partial [Thaumarchaeota archaeon]|nr:response regulator [Nitrososphaerota archaeon]
ESFFSPAMETGSNNLLTQLESLFWPRVLLRLSLSLVIDHLVIMGYHLPEMNGLDAAKELKRLAPKTEIIVATTNFSIESEAAKARFGFIIKPFGISKFLDLVDSKLSDILLTSV